MNIIALVVACAAFLCAIISAFAPNFQREGRPGPWPGWLALAIALFIAAYVIQTVFGVAHATITG